MKLTPKIKHLPDITEALKKCLREHINNLDTYNKEDNQKQLELCQVGKMLVTYFPEYEIKEVREIPDFIISNGQSEIGLEHKVITNFEIRKTQGFLENIFHLAERDLTYSGEAKNLLLNCFIRKDLTFSNNHKAELVESVKATILHYIKTEEIIQNPVIEEIVSMKHNQLSLCPNFGAYMVQDLNNELIQKAIDNKQRKIEKYKQNTNLPQWLLLVAGGASEYSYDIELDKIIDIKVETNFDKVLLMSDIDNELFEIK